MVEEDGSFTLAAYHNLVKNTKSSDWSYYTNHLAQRALDQAVSESGGIVISQKLDPMNAPQYLATFGHLFHADTVHFSEYGHRWMRDAILGVSY